MVEGGGEPSPWKGGTRVGAPCATGGTKKDGQCPGGRRRDWHWQNWQQGSAPARCPGRRWTRPEGARRVFPVAQAPGPRLIWQTGTMLHPAIQTCSVGPVRPLLPGVAVQFSLLTTQFRPSVCSFVSRASCLLLHSCHTHSHANAVMSHSAHWLLEEGLGRQAVTVTGPHGRVMADETRDDESGNALVKQRTAGGSMFLRGSIPTQVVTRPRAQRPTPAAHRQPGTPMTAVMRRGRRPDERGHQPAGAAAHSG